MSVSRSRTVVQEVNSLNLSVTSSTESCFKLLHKSIWISFYLEGPSARWNIHPVFSFDDIPATFLGESLNFLFCSFPMADVPGSDVSCCARCWSLSGSGRSRFCCGTHCSLRSGTWIDGAVRATQRSRSRLLQCSAAQSGSNDTKPRYPADEWKLGAA